MIFDKKPWVLDEHGPNVAMRCYVCARPVVFGDRDVGKACPYCGGPLIPLGRVRPAVYPEMHLHGDTRKRERMRARAATVTVSYGGCLWVYCMSEERAMRAFADLQDDIVHFARLAPGKNHCVFTDEVSWPILGEESSDCILSPKHQEAVDELLKMMNEKSEGKPND